MKATPNVVKFLLGGRIPLDAVDQSQMRELRHRADKPAAPPKI